MEESRRLVSISPSIDDMLALEIASSKPPATERWMQIDERGDYYIPEDSLCLHLIDHPGRIFVHASAAGEKI